VVTVNGDLRSALLGHKVVSGGALAMRAEQASAGALAAMATTWLQPIGGKILDSQVHVEAWVPCDARPDGHWTRLVNDLHQRLSHALGPVSVGHAAPPGDATRALVEAAEALRIGDQLFEPGHLTGYSYAQLARFLLGRPDAADLQALYERTLGKLLAEDLRKDGGLLTTLEVYCDSGCSVQRTAERLEVHRNTVQYRLKRIEEITGSSLEDGATRLLLQVGLLAGRLVRASLQRR
jgi:sugar diacid utilization regulator